MNVRIIFVAGVAGGVDRDPIPPVDLEVEIPSVACVSTEVVDEAV